MDAARSPGQVRQYYSNNGGTSFFKLNDSLGETSLTPAITVRPNSYTYLVARVEAANTQRVVYYTGNGSSWSTGTTSNHRTYTGVAVAANSTTFFSAVVANNDTKHIEIYSSTNGINWTYLTTITDGTHFKPALHWSEHFGRLILVYSNKDDFRLRIRTSTNGITWTAWDTDEAQHWANRYSAWGPGIACKPTGDFCVLQVPDGRRASTYFMEYHVEVNSQGRVRRVDTPHGIPPASGRHFATVGSSIAMAHDSTHNDFVVAFFERDAARSLNAWWRDDTHSDGQQAFKHPDYTSGGAPCGGLVAGVDATYSSRWSEVAFCYVAP